MNLKYDVTEIMKVKVRDVRRFSHAQTFTVRSNSQNGFYSYKHQIVPDVAVCTKIIATSEISRDLPLENKTRVKLIIQTTRFYFTLVLYTIESDLLGLDSV